MNENLLSKCSKMTADEIYDYLHSVNVIKTTWKDKISYADAASLFGALVYLENYGTNDKEALRKSAYNEFLSGKKDKYAGAWSYLEMLAGGKDADGLKIRILKGGSYKIKQYYLENCILKDVRGASVLLTQVEETVIPEIISDKYIRECIIYCGGGNIFAILPESCDEDFPLELEAEARRLLISTEIAYYLSKPIDASTIFGEGYSVKMAYTENELSERKKLIIANKINAKTEYIGRSFRVDAENIAINANENDCGCVCEACGKRYANYSYQGNKLCASCLHKKRVGEELKHSKYSEEYHKYTGAYPCNVNSLNDIDKNYIAVVYGDGNNMGGVIQRLRKITDMMAFSRDVKTIANKAVFEAMKENDINRFEVVGLGGDDVFVIIPGDKALKFSVKLIEKYNKQFEGKYDGETSTMSVGIAIGKSKMPINILLEAAEDKLSEAKSLSKKNKRDMLDDGSLAYTIMDTFEGENASLRNNDFFDTMQPYSLKTAVSVVEMTEKFVSGTAKTRLRNILDAFKNAESAQEAGLFFKYLNAKAKANERIKMPLVVGYKTSDGYYEKNSGKYYIWKDLMDLLDYCK